jgi:hypothetical protein
MPETILAETAFVATIFVAIIFVGCGFSRDIRSFKHLGL